jgi:hypothetical protein
MSMAKNSSNATKVQRFTKAASGAQSQFPAKTNLNLLGNTYTPAQIAVIFTAVVTAIDSIAAARAQLAAQLLALQSTETTANSLYAALEQYVKATFSKGSPVLQAFGFTVTTRKQPSSITKAIAVAKSAQTRAARGTVGSTQKQSVTTAGSPGLQLLGPNGQPITGLFPAPVAPATAPATSSSSTTAGK